MLSFLLLLLLLVPGANGQDGHNHHDHSSMDTGESNNDGAWGEWSTEDLAAAQTTFATECPSSEEPAQNSDCSNAADALLEIYVSAGSPAHVDGIGWADTVAFETDCKAAMYPTMVEAEKCAFYHGKNGAHQMGDVYMVGATHGGGGSYNKSIRGLFFHLERSLCCLHDGDRGRCC